MKVPAAISTLYEQHREQIELLHSDVKDVVYELCSKNDWLFRSRIKSKESFSQKIEVSPSYKDNGYDDFLGFEIVVNKKDEVALAVDKLKAIFLFLNARPEDASKTKTFPDSFRFEEIRLYLKKAQPVGVEPKSFRNLPFEVQIKTVFSYAWSKATHDLIYKGSKVSWARERVSYQIKAVLEQSEYAISNIENTVDAFYPKHDRYEALKTVVGLFERWPDALRPSDFKRCAENILECGKLMNLEPSIVSEELMDKLVTDLINKNLSTSPFYLSIRILIDRADLSAARVNRGYKKFLYLPDIFEGVAAEKIKQLRDKQIIFEI